MPRTLALVLLLTTPLTAQSKWAHLGPDGRLIYAHSPTGDRIVDFSYAGYHAGGVALPNVAAIRTLKPSGADDTAALQSAIDAVSALPPASRRAIQLAPGIFHLATTLNIAASGIVLRGSGPDEATGTTLQLTGNPHLALKIAGQFKQTPIGKPTTLTDAYVPSGTTVIHLADTSNLHPGDTLLLVKPVTPAWLKFMGMDTLQRPDRPEHWVGEDLTVRRRIASVNGNAVTLEVPLTDDIDTKFLNGVPPPVTHIEVTGQISETAVEDLRIAAPARSVDYREDAEFDGIDITATVDSWVRNVVLQDTTNSISIALNTERITVFKVDVQQRLAVTSSAKNFEFSSNGTQILFDRITGHGDDVFFFATQARQQGPVVVLHCHFTGDGRIEPHQRWSTGLLVDSCDVPNGGINLKNRGTMGSGHGWTIGWSVLWNNTTASLLVQLPPGTANWSIGDHGEQQSAAMPVTGSHGHGPLLRGGVIESPNKPVQPASLYLEQLRERLGPAALTAIGYNPTNP
jgi:hypothetical protein